MFGLAKHFGRNHAHDIALLLAREASEKGCDLLDVLLANPEVHGALSEQELRALLDPTNYLGRAEEVVEEVVARAAGRPSQPASSGDAGRRAVEATR
jgi:adenylosuccinate lyase